MIPCIFCVFYDMPYTLGAYLQWHQGKNKILRTPITSWPMEYSDFDIDALEMYLWDFQLKESNTQTQKFNRPTPAYTIHIGQ